MTILRTPLSHEAKTYPQALVVPLEVLNHTHLALAGGKAANLGELMQAGFDVPGGFCVTTEAYTQMSPVLEPLLAQRDSSPPDEFALAARSALQQAALPAALAQAITEAYEQLGDQVSVAVRSSATAEDLPFASFAGQQDTYLNIVGGEAVLKAVQNCWASLWTERAVSYRESLGLDHRLVHPAVVVQRIVAAETAGVLFTANPLTGKRRESVIDANPGLGEAVVSGAVNPDHFVVATATGEIRERHLGDKRLLIQPTPGGGTRRIERAAQSESACLSDEQLRALAQLGAMVEVHYGTPQDIEWALDRTGKLWLLQARPITTLYPLPADAPASDEELRVYFSFTIAQGSTQPLTPMGLSVLHALQTAMSGVRGAQAHRERNPIYSERWDCGCLPISHPPYAVRAGASNSSFSSRW